MGKIEWEHFPYELPSKSIVDAWNEKKRLSLFGGALSLYSVLFKSTLNDAKMKRNWLLNCWGWTKGPSALEFATMVGELSKHIPSLFRWFPTVKKSLYNSIKMKRGHLAIVPPCYAWRQKTPHFPTLPRSKALEIEDGTSWFQQKSARRCEEMLKLSKSQSTLMA